MFLQVFPPAARRRASGADNGKAIAVDSSSESDVDVAEPDSAGNFACCFSSEDVLRDEAQYWTNAALARRLAEEEVTAAGLDVSSGDTVLETMHSERLFLFRRNHKSSLRYAKTSSSGAQRRRRHNSAPGPAPPGTAAVVRPPRLGLWEADYLGPPGCLGGRSGVLRVSQPFSWYLNRDPPCVEIVHHVHLYFTKIKNVLSFLH